MALLHWCCWKHQEIPSIQDDAEEEENIGDLERFSLQELLDATNCFSDENKVGEGGFGKVYKGSLEGGLQVAVKRLERELTSGAALMFRTELRMISTPKHPNLLRLLGFCITPTERLLVYPYMVNGSVRSWLRRGEIESRKPFSWSLRKRIALASAKGLAYLHQCDPKIIHRDVKAANILLDDCFEAVVGDFGLAKLMDHQQTHVTTAVRGTVGHIAPEYIHSGVASEKTDVYGYGILLLELITGLAVFHLNQMAIDEDVTLFDWVKGFLVDGEFGKLVDPDLQGKFESNDVMYMTQVALLCTRGSPRYRPPMPEVVRMLEREHLEDDWKEWWQKWETPHELVQVQHQTDKSLHINAIQDSTANLRAIELSGPR